MLGSGQIGELPDRAEIEAALRKLPVSRASMEQLIAEMRPSARLFQQVGVPSVAGASRLGGAPDLPCGGEWPSYERRVESPRSRVRAPLDFIGQVRLADVPSVALPPGCPTSGLLSFFYDCEEQPWGFDPADRGGGQVMYHAEEVEVAQMTLPREVRARATRASALQFGIEWTVPDADCDPDSDLARSDVSDRWNDVERLISRWPDQPLHRLFGHPQNIQWGMTVECQVVSSGGSFGGDSWKEDPRLVRLAAEGAKDWILLLQVDTDDDSDGPGWMWGDCGRIYFWIRRQDLAARRFDRAWTILQCT